jgi:hypothetical protein
MEGCCRGKPPNAPKKTKAPNWGSPESSAIKKHRSISVHSIHPRRPSPTHRRLRRVRRFSSSPNGSPTAPPSFPQRSAPLPTTFPFASSSSLCGLCVKFLSPIGPAAALPVIPERPRTDPRQGREAAGRIFSRETSAPGGGIPLSAHEGGCPRPCWSAGSRISGRL